MALRNRQDSGNHLHVLRTLPPEKQNSEDSTSSLQLAESRELQSSSWLINQILRIVRKPCRTLKTRRRCRDNAKKGYSQLAPL